MASKDKNDRAKWAVIREWDSWIEIHPGEAMTQMGGINFFAYLHREKPEILNFPSRTADKWPTVQEWLVRERRVRS